MNTVKVQLENSNKVNGFCYFTNYFCYCCTGMETLLIENISQKMVIIYKPYYNYYRYYASFNFV